MTDREIFIYLKKKNDYKVTGLDFDYAVETDNVNKHINICLKESDSKLDWRINFNFLPTWIKFKNTYIAHRGYVYAYLSAQADLLADVIEACKANPDYKVNIYGWSYGSAVAGLVLIALNEVLSLHVSEMVTFGSVKMWYFPFLKKPFTSYAGSIREYTTPNDFVTWQAPLCHRIKNKKVGPRFNLREIFRTEYYHCNYQDFITD